MDEQQTEAQKVAGPGVPADLEDVRAFLNTWRIPNDTRRPTDLLLSEEARERFMARTFPQINDPADLDAACMLRDDLRAMLGSNEITKINGWLSVYPIKAILAQDAAGTPVVKYRPARKVGTLGSEVLWRVLEAIAEGTWGRLKSCPDCQWVFYDSTKNSSKIWCGMLANGPEGRACGSISKVRNWRERQKLKKEQ